MDFYTIKMSAENRQQEFLREAEKQRLARQAQADQILSRWVLGLLRRSLSQPSQATPVKQAAPQRRALVRNGG